MCVWVSHSKWRKWKIKNESSLWCHCCVYVVPRSWLMSRFTCYFTDIVQEPVQRKEGHSLTRSPGRLFMVFSIRLLFQTRFHRKHTLLTLASKARRVLGCLKHMGKCSGGGGGGWKPKNNERRHHRNDDPWLWNDDAHTSFHVTVNSLFRD